MTWPRGARRRHETSASAWATSETLALCRIGKQYAVSQVRSLGCDQFSVGALSM